MATFKDSLQLLGVSLMPQHLVSRLAGHFARSPLSKAVIPLYIRHFDIDVGQAEKPVGDYETLLSFFIRRLKPGMRPMAMEPDVVISPVDGAIYAAGAIEDDQLWQIKGETYSLLDFLGGDRRMAEKFQDGQFMTIYLSPQDYHRIHVPFGGQVKQANYIPGSLFPVNPFALRNVTRLFARNERLATFLETRVGTMAVVKVGATIVGSVRVVYGDYHTNAGRKAAVDILDGGPRFAKGDELGRFEFGSTVILLFEKGQVKLRDLKVGDKVVLGQPVADVVGIRS